MSIPRVLENGTRNSECPLSDTLTDKARKHLGRFAARLGIQSSKKKGCGDLHPLEGPDDLRIAVERTEAALQRILDEYAKMDSEKLEGILKTIESRLIESDGEIDSFLAALYNGILCMLAEHQGITNFPNESSERTTQVVQ